MTTTIAVAAAKAATAAASPNESDLLEKIRKPLNEMQRVIFDNVLGNLNEVILVQAGPGT